MVDPQSWGPFLQVGFVSISWALRARHETFETVTCAVSHRPPPKVISDICFVEIYTFLIQIIGLGRIFALSGHGQRQLRQGGARAAGDGGRAPGRAAPAK